MKRILINDNNLNSNDMDYSVVRVKGLVVNSNGELILVQNNNTFQFPGGHYRKDESLEECLAREIREELGIHLDVNNGPFMLITTYDPDYFDSGSKVENRIYYYVVKTDIEPNPDDLRLDAIELDSDFNILKIRLDELTSFLNKCMEDGSIDKCIGREMLLVAEEVSNII